MGESPAPFQFKTLYCDGKKKKKRLEKEQSKRKGKETERMKGKKKRGRK